MFWEVTLFQFTIYTTWNFLKLITRCLRLFLSDVLMFCSYLHYISQNTTKWTLDIGQRYMNPNVMKTSYPLKQTTELKHSLPQADFSMCAHFSQQASAHVGWQYTASGSKPQSQQYPSHRPRQHSSVGQLCSSYSLFCLFFFFFLKS